MKNWKMRSAIMVIVLVTTLIGIGALFLMASSRNQKALSKSTSDNMTTYLTAQANTIENFVTEKENNLKLFGKSYDVRRIRCRYYCISGNRKTLSVYVCADI